MFLKDFDNFNRYFDTDFEKVIYMDDCSKINGWFKLFKKSLSALLVQDKKLYFLLDKEKFEINTDYSVKLKNGHSQNSKLLMLCKGNTVVVQFTYEKSMNYANISPFEYLDEEDFDWGKFIARIVNDDNRKITFINNLTTLNHSDG